MIETLKRIQNGDLHDTKFYDHDWKLDGTLSDFEQRQASVRHNDHFKLYGRIRNLIGDKYVAGDYDSASSHYTNLRLTKNGENLLKLGSLTYTDIVSSKSWKEWFLKPIIVEVFKRFVPWLLLVIVLIASSYALGLWNSHDSEPHTVKTIKA